MRKLIYIAGPITGGLPGHNYGQAVDAYINLVRLGYAPICPHKDMAIPGSHRIDYESYMEVDFAQLAMCEALLRLPGESPGADREVEFARVNEIPVYFDIQDLKNNVPCR